eukprot:scaffold114179_cov21-Tisochrysis_lutea.AAC.2
MKWQPLPHLLPLSSAALMGMGMEVGARERENAPDAKNQHNNEGKSAQSQKNVLNITLCN